MAVRQDDPNAKQSKTVTAPYGANGTNPNLNPAQPSGAQTKQDETVNNPLAQNLGPDVGSVAAPTYNTPTVHELAVATVNERGGPNAAAQPNYKDQIKQVEDEINATLSRTQGA